MAPPTDTSSSPAYRPGLAVSAAAAAAWVFVLVTLGAFTTSIGAGMVFPDWPLSNGSLNPHGWRSDLAMFAEHSHRLSAGIMTILTVVIAVWIGRTDPRRWLRRLAYGAVGLVVAQAVVGGLRVLLDHLQLPSLETNVGQLFAMLHACLAQAFVCALIAIAVSCSRGWIQNPRPVGPFVRKAGIVCCALLFIQLAIAAVVRHSFAGLAIPTFPWSTPQGGLLPDHWDFRIAIQFAHRAMAAVIAVAIIVFVLGLRRDRGASIAMRAAASSLVTLLALQIMLGAAIIRTLRDPGMMTGHVLVGALTLATTFWLTWCAHRDAIES